MKKYGEIGGVKYTSQGFDINNLAIKYKLSHNNQVSYAFVNYMPELRNAIAELKRQHSKDEPPF